MRRMPPPNRWGGACSGNTTPFDGVAAFRRLDGCPLTAGGIREGSFGAKIEPNRSHSGGSGTARNEITSGVRKSYFRAKIAAEG